MWLELEERERAFLLALLEESLGDIRDEIYRAESHEFKERLRGRKEVVQGLLARLRAAAAAGSEGGRGPAVAPGGV